jgi:hypothetical protein
MTGYQSKRAAAQDKLAQPEQELWAGVDFDIKTTPPQRPWVGLTKDDTFEIAERLGLADVAWLDLMVAIEAKLKEKNA